jgi:predicted P-loop ATPase
MRAFGVWEGSVWVMKLEVGKYYKNQNGEKVKALDYTVGGRFILHNIEKGYLYTVDALGKTYAYTDTIEDLISEWVEPVEHEVDVHFFKVGDAIVFGNNPFYKDKRIAKIKVKFTEGEGL